MHFRTKLSRLALALCAVISILISRTYAQNQDINQPKIFVNGEAVVYVKPDRIHINFGVETLAPEIATAKVKNNEIVRRALTLFRESGIAEKDIQTDHISIVPHYPSNYPKVELLGYFARNSIAITVNDAARVEDLVSKALGAGVNYVHGVNFQIVDLKKYREEARVAALKAAREKGEKMSAVLGQTIGRPLQINDNSGGVFNSSSSSWGSLNNAAGRAWAQNSVQNMGAGGGEVGETVALGQIAIHASVMVVFELKN
jgi:uncharacterized protein YggE